jgi:glycosyltransferase involved in cell wall biosynthesis
VSAAVSHRAHEHPQVSVIVPARNAADFLPRLFAALDRSTYPGPWETVVVDDASTDATAQLAEEWGARVVRMEKQSGPAASRNAGLATARAPLIAFTDADCEPCRDWLSLLTRGLGEADIVLGPIRPTPGVPRTAFDRTLSTGRESPLFETANLAVRRDLVERVGGFESFAPVAGVRTGLRPTVDQGHFGEDAVFGWRARRAGARVAYVDDALVHHAVFPRGARGYIAERWRLRFFPALVREVPELRSRLTWRYFLTERTALFDLAVLGIGASLASGRRAPLLAALPYLKRRLIWRRAWRRSVARRNAAMVIGDAVGFVALVRGSAAARRLLL